MRRMRRGTTKKKKEKDEEDERGIGSIERAKSLLEKVFFTREQSCGGRNISTQKNW